MNSVLGPLGSRRTDVTGLSGRPALISVQPAPPFVERYTWPPLPFVKPEKVTTTSWALAGLTARDVTKRPDVPTVPAEISVQLRPSLVVTQILPSPAPT